MVEHGRISYCQIVKGKLAIHPLAEEIYSIDTKITLTWNYKAIMLAETTFWIGMVDH